LKFSVEKLCVDRLKIAVSIPAISFPYERLGLYIILVVKWETISPVIGKKGFTLFFIVLSKGDT